MKASSTAADPRERELANLRSRIAAARSYGMYADLQAIAAMEERRDQLERHLAAEQVDAASSALDAMFEVLP